MPSLFPSGAPLKICIDFAIHEMINTGKLQLIWSSCPESTLESYETDSRCLDRSAINVRLWLLLQVSESLSRERQNNAIFLWICLFLFYSVGILFVAPSHLFCFETHLIPFFVKTHKQKKIGMNVAAMLYDFETLFLNSVS